MPHHKYTHKIWVNYHLLPNNVLGVSPYDERKHYAIDAVILNTFEHDNMLTCLENMLQNDLITSYSIRDYDDVPLVIATTDA